MPFLERHEERAAFERRANRIERAPVACDLTRMITASKRRLSFPPRREGRELRHRFRAAVSFRPSCRIASTCARFVSSTVTSATLAREAA